jgi:hypothetical protein
MKKVRQFLIKHLAFNYDYKAFGKTRAFLRVINPAVLLFCIAGLFNVLTRGFSIWQALSFLPFIAVLLIWRFYFIAHPPLLSELTWEQKFQRLKTKRRHIDERKKFERVKELWAKKYLGPEKFLEIKRAVFSFAVILISLAIYLMFGFYEAGFESLRGF